MTARSAVADEHGQYVQEFERQVAARIGVRHCVAVSNWPVGIGDIDPGAWPVREVVVPSYTFAATAHAYSGTELRRSLWTSIRRTHTIDVAASRADHLAHDRYSCRTSLGQCVRRRRARRDCGSTEAEDGVRRCPWLRLFLQGAHDRNYGDAEISVFMRRSFSMRLKGVPSLPTMMIWHSSATDAKPRLRAR